MPSTDLRSIQTQQEMIRIKLRGYTPELYLDLPPDLAHRLGSKRGFKLRCLIHKLEDRLGNLILQDRELILEIKQRDFRAFFPSELARSLGLTGGEKLELEILEVS